MPDAARTIDMDETRARIRELMTSDAPAPADDGEDEGLHGLGRGMAYLTGGRKLSSKNFELVFGTGEPAAPYRNIKDLRGVLPTDLWLRAYKSPLEWPKAGDAGHAESQALNASIRRFACIVAREDRGVSDPVLDAAIFKEGQCRDEYRRLARFYRNKGVKS